MKLLSLLGAVLAAASCADCITVCYYGSWATYRKGNGKVNVEDIDPHMCTHLVYAFAGVDHINGVIKVFEPDNDLCPVDGGRLCGYQRFNDRKKQNPDLKTLLAVGGWNEGSESFSIVASNQQKRKSFVDSVVVLLKKHGFDGLDMDWEYPGSRNGSSPNDRENFVTLLEELHEALSAKKLMLTAAVAAGKDTIDKGYDVPGMVSYLDYIFLMAYDMFGPWDNFTNHNAPLYADPLDVGDNAFKNVNFSVNYWLNLSTPAEKLVLGLGTYGRCWSLPSNTADPGFYSISDGPGPAGPYTNVSGFLGYNELCERQKNEQWKVRKSSMNETYAYYVDGNQAVWCGYDDERSIKIKAEYASALGLAGVMIWSLETDDVHGVCHKGNKFTLIKAADEVFHGKQPKGQESVLSCYYESWAIYKPEDEPEGSLAVVAVKDLTDLADVCTHLIYAFAKINGTTGEIEVKDNAADLCPEDEGGVGWSHCGYRDFTDLKKSNYQLKTLIAVGGYGKDIADVFSKVAADPVQRGKFVASVVLFLRKHNFDGLDMDWEYPGPEDKVNFVTLLSELAEALQHEGLLLTTAVPVGKDKIDDGYDVPGVSRHVDLIHVMAYDYHGTWANTTHHNAPLYKHHSDPNDLLTVNYTIRYWMELGAPADKLVLGLPLYGRCWTLDDPSKNGVGAPGTAAPKGPYSEENGIRFYSEICKINNDWTIVDDEDMQVPYGYSSLDNIWCGYDHENSIANKAEYAATLGLRGVMAWAIDQDDVHKECGSQNLNFPLTRKAWEAFNSSLTTASPTTDTPTTTVALTTIATATSTVTTVPTTNPTTAFTTTSNPTTTESSTTVSTATETITTSLTTSTTANTGDPDTTTSDQPESTTATNTEVSSSTTVSPSISTSSSSVFTTSASVPSTTIKTSFITTESSITTGLSTSTMTTKDSSTSALSSTSNTSPTITSSPWPIPPARTTYEPPSPLSKPTIIGIALGTVFGSACIGTVVFWFYINKKLCFAAAVAGV